MRKFIDLFKFKKKVNLNNFEWSIKADKENISESKLKQVIGTGRQLIYSKEAKKQVSENKVILKSFLDLFKLRLNDEEQINWSKNILLKSGRIMVVQLKELKNITHNSYHTNNFYLFSIGSKKESKKFFVKYVHDSIDIKNGFNGINEIAALDIIKNAGFNVVPAHLSYVDYTKKKSFIFYEFQDKLIDAEKAYNQKLITHKDIINIRKKLAEVENTVNKNIESYTKLHIKGTVIKDVVPHWLKSFEALPVFIDLDTKKLYIYDPLLQG